MLRRFAMRVAQPYAVDAVLVSPRASLSISTSFLAAKGKRRSQKASGSSQRSARKTKSERDSSDEVLQEPTSSTEVLPVDSLSEKKMSLLDEFFLSRGAVSVSEASNVPQRLDQEQQQQQLDSHKADKASVISESSAVPAPPSFLMSQKSSADSPLPALAVQDPQPPLSLFDPAQWEATLEAEAPLPRGPIATAYYHNNNESGRGTPTNLWPFFHGNEGKSTAPEWFEALCYHLFFQTSQEAVASAGSSLKQESSNSASEPIDPFLYLPFEMMAEDAYRVGPYSFPSTFGSSVYRSTESKMKLCLGNRQREYVAFASGYRFPDRRQLPTSEGTEPVTLYVDPLDPHPVVYIQLSAEFPPALWLPVKATADAVRRVLAEFASAAAVHYDRHAEAFVQRWNEAQQHMKLQRMPDLSGAATLRYVSWAARNVPPAHVSFSEFPNSQELFLGEYDDPEKFMEHVDLCPFLFAIPLLRGVTDVHKLEHVPRVDGPGVNLSLYRTVYSKSLLLLQVHLSCEVKLPPQDIDSFVFMWKDAEQAPKSRIPVFVRVVWADNQRMSGGGNLVRRFNEAFGTEFSPDMPIDVCLGIHALMSWAQQSHSLLGVRGMRQRVDELEASAKQPQPPLLYPGTRDIPNPEYTQEELLGMHLQYLAHLGDPDIKTRIERLLPEASAVVRMGCAKAALEIADRELFRRIVSSEPPGRMQTYMTKLVRKRKTRDLVDPIPRLLDDQYEFAAPLWTRRARLDLNTIEGAAGFQRLEK